MINSSAQKASNALPKIGKLLALLYLCAFGSNEAYAQKHAHKEEDAIAIGFVNAIKSRNFDDLKKYFPTVSVFRTTAPDETKGKTDAEILEIAKPMNDDLDSAYHSLLREADGLKVDVKKISFTSQRSSTIPMTGGGFYLQEIFFKYGKKKGTFTIGTAYINDKWYIYAIEKSVGVFSELK